MLQYIRTTWTTPRMVVDRYWCSRGFRAYFVVYHCVVLVVGCMTSELETRPPGTGPDGCGEVATRRVSPVDRSSAMLSVETADREAAASYIPLPRAILKQNLSFVGGRDVDESQGN